MRNPQRDVRLQTFKRAPRLSLRARRRIFFWLVLLATAALYVTVTKAIDLALETWARTWP